MKWSPMPNVFDWLLEISDLQERIAQAKTKEQLAYTILRLFWEASNITNNKHKKATFKVCISELDTDKAASKVL